MAIDPLDESVTAALRGWQIQHAAGVGVAQALESCATLCQTRETRECFQAASNRAAAGFEDILESLRPLLAPAELALLAAGWKGGRFEAVLAAAAAQRELWAATRRKVRSRMMLPVGVLLLAAFVAPLPRFLTDGSGGGYLSSALLPLAVAFLAWRCGGAWLQARSKPRGPGAGEPLKFDRFLLSLPIVGEIERQRSLAQFAGALGLLSGSGMPLLAALETCARAVPNRVYEREIRRFAAHAGQGRPLSSALGDESLWPAPFVAAVVVGEKSGALEKTLLHLSNAAREDYSRAVERLGEWLPRIAYGLVALYVIWQIFQLVSRVGGMYQGVLP
ncbi:MAG: type II secretion system F family protein [Planctomycetota bacterium]